MTGGLGGAALVAAMALVPVIALMLTSFVKISVVLSLLRNAIGAPDVPSGLIVVGMSLILSLFVMAPVAIEMARAAQPAPPGRATASPVPAGPPPPAASPSAPAPGAPPAAPLDLEGAVRALVPAPYQPQLAAATRALVPLRGFLAQHASARDRDSFTALASRMGRAVRGDEIWVLAPAFLTTELREAFAIAVLIFVPFLVIDLVVGLGLAALGLSATSPQAIALPLKLLLVVAVDGWRLLIDGLLRGYV
jgi:type III secretion protein R